MHDPTKKAHLDFIQEMMWRNINRVVAGPFCTKLEDGSLQVTGCYSHSGKVIIPKEILGSKVENSVLDIKGIKLDEKNYLMVFWKDGWFGYTTTLH